MKLAFFCLSKPFFVVMRATELVKHGRIHTMIAFTSQTAHDKKCYSSSRLIARGKYKFEWNKIEEHPDIITFMAK